MRTIRLHVVGMPAPQGSKRHIGRGILIESSRQVSQWRQDVIAQSAAYHGARMDGPLQMTLTFYLPRPRARRRQVYSDRRPDLSKLIRSTEDALVDAGILADDARVAVLSAAKEYVRDGVATTPGAYIEISEIEG